MGRGYQGNDSQRWILTAKGSNAYTIQQKCNGRYLDAFEDSAHDFDGVTRGYQGNDSQLWIIQSAGAGVYTIQQKVNMRFLDAYEDKTYQVVTRGKQSNPSQQWYIGAAMFEEMMENVSNSSQLVMV